MAFYLTATSNLLSRLRAKSSHVSELGSIYACVLDFCQYLRGGFRGRAEVFFDWALPDVLFLLTRGNLRLIGCSVQGTRALVPLSHSIAISVAIYCPCTASGPKFRCQSSPEYQTSQVTLVHLGIGFTTLSSYYHGVPSNIELYLFVSQHHVPGN